MAQHFSLDRTPLTTTTAHGADRPILTRRVLEAADSKALNFIDLTIVPPGSYIGEHTHTDDNEEIYVIVSGHGMMLADEERFEVGAGDVVVNRPGGTHALWNTGPAELRLVVIEVPVRATSPSGSAEGRDAAHVHGQGAAGDATGRPPR
ncbi:MAG TPA: cupin domain-containing protein [Pseudomonadales bacterium]